VHAEVVPEYDLLQSARRSANTAASYEFYGTALLQRSLQGQGKATTEDGSKDDGRAAAFYDPGGSSLSLSSPGGVSPIPHSWSGRGVNAPTRISAASCSARV
jgi:hypothetical protein